MYNIVIDNILLIYILLIIGLNTYIHWMLNRLDVSIDIIKYEHNPRIHITYLKNTEYITTTLYNITTNKFIVVFISYLVVYSMLVVPVVFLLFILGNFFNYLLGTFILVELVLNLFRIISSVKEHQ